MGSVHGRYHWYWCRIYVSGVISAIGSFKLPHLPRFRINHNLVPFQIVADEAGVAEFARSAIEDDARLAVERIGSDGDILQQVARGIAIEDIELEPNLNIRIAVVQEHDA